MLRQGLGLDQIRIRIRGGRVADPTKDASPAVASETGRV